MDGRTIIESLLTLLCPGSDPQRRRYVQLHLLEKGSVTQALTQLESSEESELTGMTLLEAVSHAYLMGSTDRCPKANS